ncbi:MAG: glucosaminidase domain-containing protein [Bacteroidales bacterium]
MGKRDIRHTIITFIFIVIVVLGVLFGMSVSGQEVTESWFDTASSATLHPLGGEHIEVVIEETVEYKGVLSPSNLTAEELESGLLHDLKQYADCFIQAEEDTGINAVFLASVAALESGWARSKVSAEFNNLFGWSTRDSFYYFSSKEECIAFVANKIKELYLSENGIYFNGYEVSDINVKYNGRKHWEDSVLRIMSEIVHRTEKGS